MIKIENVEVIGWEHTIRGMRNPMNSWDKSDSYEAVDCGKCGLVEEKGICTKEDRPGRCENYKCYVIGENDLDLMKRLRKAGTDHRKFMRMITVYLDITAPLYFFKEWDTYKVGTVANSCSTMHKIHSKEFTLDDFSTEHLDDESVALMEQIISNLNECRNVYNNGAKWDFGGGAKGQIKPQSKEYWWQMIQLLPSSYNQKRTVMLNYEVLANMYKSRKAHKLDEWREFCKWIETLPYSELITGEE